MNDPWQAQLDELERTLRASLYPDGHARRVGVLPRLMAAPALRLGARREYAPMRGARRTMAGSAAVVFASVLVVVVVVVGALLLIHGRSSHRPTAAASAGAAGLIKRLAVLRRRQTPRDRGDLVAVSGQQPGLRGIAETGLTRLATTIRTPTLGTVHVYLAVGQREQPAVSRAGAAVDTVSAVAVPSGQRAIASTPAVSASHLTPLATTSSGLKVPGEGVDPDAGLTMSVVPDGVTHVRWTFTGASFGLNGQHPRVIEAAVHGNVAVTPVTPRQGPLARVAWLDASGRIVATATGGAQARRQLQTIRSVNAARGRPIARLLSDHYDVFDALPADTPAKDWRLQTPGTSGGFEGQLGLSYWQARYVSTVTGLDGRGLWIIPGARGICIYDPRAGSCGPLTTVASTVIVGVASSAHGEMTLTGLVPDGNPTLTLVLSNGSRLTVDVVDHNVWEATVHGRITAIIAHDIDGHRQKHTLG